MDETRSFWSGKDIVYNVHTYTNKLQLIPMLWSFVQFAMACHSDASSSRVQRPKSTYRHIPMWVELQEQNQKQMSDAMVVTFVIRLLWLTTGSFSMPNAMVRHAVHNVENAFAMEIIIFVGKHFVHECECNTATYGSINCFRFKDELNVFPDNDERLSGHLAECMTDDGFIMLQHCKQPTFE